MFLIDSMNSSKLPNLFKILRKIFEPVIAQYIFLLTFIYLTVQFLAILGIINEPYNLVPEPIRTYTIIIGTPLIILYMFFTIYNYIVYDWAEDKVRIIEDRFKMSEKPKDPRQDVKENLTYRDIEFAISCLMMKLKNSGKLKKIDERDVREKNLSTEKNMIIGIDRGGAIVGGLLAKGLHLATKNVGIYWVYPSKVGVGKKTPIIPERCLDNINFNNVETVILVDDAIRSGKSMKELIRLLGEKNPNNNKFKVLKVCILDVYNLQDRDNAVNPDFFVYKYRSEDQNDAHKIDLPWDNWDPIKIKDEWKEYCDNVR